MTTPRANPEPEHHFDAIVVVDHGSRRDEANEVVVEAAERLQALHPDVLVVAAHCEFAVPSLPDAVERCVVHGAARIVIQPFYLVPGRHSSEDIPRIVGVLTERYPQVRFRIGKALGAHAGLVAALEDRIAEVTSLAAADEDL